jgi:hypothetical protein
VETAGVILLFLLGLLVHYRLAKLIEKRKGHKESIRQQRAEDLEREETALGRRIEDNNVGEMVAWNKAYDGKRISVTTGPASIESMAKISEKRRSTAQDLELSQSNLVDDRGLNRNSKNATMGIKQAEGDGMEIETAQEMNRSLNAVNVDGPSSKRSTLNVGPQPDSEATPLGDSAPEVIPLPFKIPGVQTEIPNSAPGSLSAIEDLLSPGRLSSQRNSGMSSTWKRDSVRNTLHEETRSTEDLFSDVDDRDSSLAATLDEREEDEVSLSEVSAPRSPLPGNGDNLSPKGTLTPAASPSLCPSDGSTCLDKIGDLVPVGPTPAIPEKSAKRNSISDLRESAINVATQDITNLSPEDAIAENANTQKTSETSAPIAIDDTGTTEAMSGDAIGKAKATRAEKEIQRSLKSRASTGPSDPAEAGSIVSLKALLPAGPSKTERMYRTNEWSKHQDPEAAGPDQDIIEGPPSPGVRVETSFNDAAAQGPPISPVVNPDQVTIPPRSSKRMSTKPTAAESQSQSPNTAFAPQATGSSLNLPQSSRSHSESPIPNNHSTATLDPASSYDSHHDSEGNSRNSSTVQLQATNDSAEMLPVARPTSARPTSRMGTPKQVGSASHPRTSETLIGKRESLVKSRQTSLAFAQSSTSLAQDNSDDIPLSQHRKSLIQSPTRPSSHRQDTWPAPAHHLPAQSALSLTNLDNFDSHQPKRNSNTVTQGQRAERLTSWREGLREERPTNTKRHSGRRASFQPQEDANMQSLLNAKRQQEQAFEREKLKKQARDQAIENAMRSGALIDAHNRKLRDMQGDSGS